MRRLPRLRKESLSYGSRAEPWGFTGMWIEDPGSPLTTISGLVSHLRWVE